MAFNPKDIDSIAKQRSFIESIWGAPHFAETKKRMLREIDELLKKVYSFVLLMDGAEATKKIEERFHPARFQANYAGIVAKEHHEIRQVVFGDGNLREKMTLIYGFGANSCDLTWDMLIAYSEQNKLWKRIKHLLNESDMQRRLADVELKFGFKMKDIQKTCKHEKCKKKRTLIYSRTFPSMCHALRYNKFGPVLFARSDIKPPVRFQVKDKNVQKSRAIKFREVIPRLSVREAKMILEHNLTSTNADGDLMIEWSTGHRVFDVEANSIFGKVFSDYGRLQIAGVSGNTDLHLDVSLQFANTSLFYNLMACVVWMGNPVDHSLSEILFATKSSEYQSTFVNNETYDVSDDPYVFILDQSKRRAAVGKIAQNNGIFRVRYGTFFLVGIGVALLILGLIVAVVWRRKRKQSPAEEEKEADEYEDSA